jgi:uncharacterized membrane protein
MTDRSFRTSFTRLWALATFAVLVAAQALDSYLKDAPAVIWALRLAPLLVFLPGLVADRVRTYIWLCFVILLYFVTLVLRLFVDPLDPVAWVAMVSIVVFFATAMMYARWRSQELHGEQPPAVEGG